MQTLKADPGSRKFFLINLNLHLCKYLYRDPVFPGLVTVHVNVSLQVELCGETFGTTVTIVDGFIATGVPLVLVHTRVGLMQKSDIKTSYWLKLSL